MRPSTCFSSFSNGENLKIFIKLKTRNVFLHNFVFKREGSIAKKKGAVRIKKKKIYI